MPRACTYEDLRGCTLLCTCWGLLKKTQRVCCVPESEYGEILTQTLLIGPAGNIYFRKRNTLFSFYWSVNVCNPTRSVFQGSIGKGKRLKLPYISLIENDSFVFNTIRKA